MRKAENLTVEELQEEYNKIKALLPEGYTNTDLCEIEFRLRNALIYDIPLDRLEQICQAEKDGRCYITPCKVGDEVWIMPKSKPYYCRLCNEFHGGKPIKTKFKLEMLGDFGKTVFLTKTEAEAKLAELEGK